MKKYKKKGMGKKRKESYRKKGRKGL